LVVGTKANLHLYVNGMVKADSELKIQTQNAAVHVVFGSIGLVAVIMLVLLATA
jgi:hypothetical protein